MGWGCVWTAAKDFYGWNVTIGAAEGEGEPEDVDGDSAAGGVVLARKDSVVCGQDSPAMILEVEWHQHHHLDRWDWHDVGVQQQPTYRRHSG